MKTYSILPITLLSLFSCFGQYGLSNSRISDIAKYEISVDLPKIRLLKIKTVFGDAVPDEFKISSIYQYANRKIVIYDSGDNRISGM